MNAPDFTAMQPVPRDERIAAGDWLVFPNGAYAQVRQAHESNSLNLHNASKPGYGLLSEVSVARRKFEVYRPKPPQAAHPPASTVIEALDAVHKARVERDQVYEQSGEPRSFADYRLDEAVNQLIEAVDQLIEAEHHFTALHTEAEAPEET